MAVAFGTSVNATPATGTSLTSPSITTPASNPVVMVHVGLNHATAVVSSLTITGFGGTAVEVKNARVTGATSTLYSVWKIIAPAGSTAGTVRANISASCPIQLAVETFSGADQSDPAPNADAVSSIVATTPVTLTPANLVVGDATTGGAANSEFQDLTAISPNSRYLGNSSPVNLAMGDATSTTGITSGTNIGLVTPKIAVRIRQPSGPPPPPPAGPPGSGLLNTLRSQIWT